MKKKNAVKEVAIEIVWDTFVKYINLLRLHSLKSIFLNKKERIGYIAVTVFALWFFERNNPSFFKFLLSLNTYFTWKAIYQELREEIFRRKHSGFTRIFSGNAKVIDVVKEKKPEKYHDNMFLNYFIDKVKAKNTGIITYTVFSFVPRSKIINNKETFEHYFNSNVVKIEQDKYNKKRFTIVTSKNKVKEKLDNSSQENKLINILNNFGFNATLNKKIENDFFEKIYIDCNADIKKVLGKIDDIAYKLKIDDSRLTIEVENGLFTFQIKKEKQQMYYLVDYIDNIKVNKKYILPVLLGMHQDSNQCLIDDIYDLIHCLVMGMNGSGKSSTLNTLIQSLMYFVGGHNSKWIMYDFKGTELNQYENFKNVSYLNNPDDLVKSIKKLEKIMNDRGKLFAKEGVKDIKQYNNKFPNKKLPYIFLVIDEFAAIMMTLPKEMSSEINRILVNMINLCRASGIRFIISTQKPVGSQVDTGILSQIQTKFIHKISKSDKKVLMIEEDVHKYKKGEFLLEAENYTAKMKGLFIDTENEKYNKVYELLCQKYLNKGE